MHESVIRYDLRIYRMLSYVDNVLRFNMIFGYIVCMLHDIL